VRLNMPCCNPYRGFLLRHSSQTCSVGGYQRAGLPGLCIDLYQPRPACLGRKALALGLGYIESRPFRPLWRWIQKMWVQV
jgi:hypothetical protein